MSISRPLAAGAVMGLILAAAGRPPLSHLMFIAAGVSILMSVETERPGYLHSVPSVLVLSFAAIATSFLWNNILWGIGAAVGLVSHLLVDSLDNSLYIRKKDGEWFSVMPEQRWAKHGDAAVSLVSGVLLVGMVVLG